MRGLCNHGSPLRFGEAKSILFSVCATAARFPRLPQEQAAGKEERGGILLCMYDLSI